MTKTKKSILMLLVLVFAVSMIFVSCTTTKTPAVPDQDIVVLYTNDVHCGYKKNIGYAGLGAYKKAMLAETPYVTLVDIGDAVQGETIGTVSTGSYIVEMMNAVGYDLAVFGNHEFDYGMDRLAELMEMANAQYLCSTITYNGKNQNKLEKALPYVIKNYGDVKVGFIGVSTHETLVKSTPKYFMEDGKFVYDFATGEALYKTVQKYVNKVRKAGADYVVVLSHLGIEEGSEPDRGIDLIANTTGIDVLVDGHSHSTVECDLVQDKCGKSVIYTQTGTKFENIGVLTINTNGEISTKLVQPTEKDADVEKVINAIDDEYLAAVKVPVAKSEVSLDINDAQTGKRAVRNRETAIGDLCADAYRYMSGADVAFVNGGGIRAAINKGSICLDDIIKIHPYGNKLCMCEATGQEILDALEWGSQSTKSVKVENGNAAGESGGFLQVSGLKYTIDTSVATTVVKDENGMFGGVAGARRVKDVFVGSEEEGWTPIDPNKTYTLACHNYKLQDMGDGYNMFVDNNYLLDNTMIDNQVLINYIVDGLNGVVGSEYAQPKGRITVL